MTANRRSGGSPLLTKAAPPTAKAAWRTPGRLLKTTIWRAGAAVEGRQPARLGQARQFPIDQGQIRRNGAGLRQQRLTIRGLADNLQPRLLRQQHPHRKPDALLIIGNQDSHVRSNAPRVR